MFSINLVSKNAVVISITVAMKRKTAKNGELVSASIENKFCSYFAVKLQQKPLTLKNKIIIKS